MSISLTDHQARMVADLIRNTAANSGLAIQQEWRAILATLEGECPECAESAGRCLRHAL